MRSKHMLCMVKKGLLNLNKGDIAIVSCDLHDKQFLVKTAENISILLSETAFNEYLMVIKNSKLAKKLWQ